MDQIKAGSIVWLKTGSLPMTVYDTDGKTARCDWFDEQNKHNQQTFAIDQLTTKKPDL